MAREIRNYEISVDDTLEPIPFSLTFVRKSDGSSETHDFEAAADPGAGASLAVSGLVRYDKHGNQQIDLNGLKAFFDRVMDEDVYKRFLDLLADKDLTIPMDVLGRIFTDLMEEYTGRPIPQSSGSTTRRRRTGPPSTDPPSLTVAT